MKEEENLIIPDEIISNKIYLIRNQKVMLDRDLSELYQVETKQLKRQVRRNIERFPEDFMFELTEKENENLRSQIGTSSWGGSRYVPMVFTEQGVAMLSSVLKSDRAIAVNIKIIRIFTKMRDLLSDNLSLRLEIEQIKKKMNNHDKNIELVFSYLDELVERKEEKKERTQIGYKKD
ncbi:ORF6N domain-containing protein [Polaribacter sp. KT25b]|uniref:ORF6N domain-containing protein n=1 Tax=Polaribacter sp. KT25b TaxID=1855336 RepID=UPI00087D5608|nr:ORF6N domain-containing protein [Polaribacter sp. KT25b]SDS01313.1 ORF6N domain-containing protein [Polaribacter sp. KT25b]